MGTDKLVERIQYALLLALAFSLPFEIIRPVVALPWFSFTNLEVLTVLALGFWAVRLWGDRPVGAIGQPPVWSALLFLGLSFLSAALAPAHQGDALKFATRMATGVAVFWMLAESVRTRTHLRQLLWALVLGSGASALVGLGEAVAWSPLEPVLPLFKAAPTKVGGELRVSASFQYATIAAMFFEMTVPLAVALVATTRRPVSRLLGMAVGLLGTANIVLTFSRAGMLTLILALVAMLVLGRRRRLRPLVPPALLALAGLFALTGALAWQRDTFRTRLITENDLGWYGAAYTAPSHVTLRAGEPNPITITVQNTGQATWHTTGTQPFALGYYWLDDAGQPLDAGHGEAALPHSVTPGQTVDVTLTLEPSLPPGRYRLTWGMLQHGVLWFRHRDVPEAHTTVTIEPGAGPVPPPPSTAGTVPGGEAPSMPPTVGRMSLWKAAVLMWAQRPLLGMGPDNFRHLYGTYLGLSVWDVGLHTNNLYLELLTGWGLAGALAFAGLAGAIALSWYRLWRQAWGASAIYALALGASFLAFFVHGMLDCFLGFVPTLLLLCSVAGLILAAERLYRSSSGLLIEDQEPL
ncbi:MAG: O-antigen ligase family protein [Anaerolineae bacterium]